MEQASRRRSALLGALVIAVASQVSMGLEPGAFTISIAVVLLPALCSLWPVLPVAWSMVLAAPGVFLLRALARLTTVGTMAGSWNAHAPEMVFYVCYGLLFELYRHKVRFHPFPLWACLPLAGLDAFPLTAFNDQPFILTLPGRNTDTEQLLVRNGLKPHIKYTTVDSFAAYSMVEAGLGLSINNVLMAKSWNGRVKILPLDPPQILHLGILVPNLRDASPAARKCIECVRQIVSSL